MALKFTLYKLRPYFLPDVGRLYLLWNFNKLIKGKGVDERSQIKERTMVIMISKVWSLNVTLVPSIKLEVHEASFGKLMKGCA